MPIATYKFTVEGQQIGFNNRLKLSGLADILQLAAWRHAVELGFGLEELIAEYGLTWAMAKLQIKVEDFPVYGSELKVITWPKRKDHFYAYRDLEVYCKDQKIATATSSYLMIDLKTRRPVSLIDKYEHLLDQENKHAVEEPPKKIASFQPMNWMEIKTGLTDLDINNHVNNVKYLDWAQNTQPIEFWAQHVVKEVSVNYFSELLADEYISVGILLNSNELTVSGVVKDKEKFRVEIKTQVV